MPRLIGAAACGVRRQRFAAGARTAIVVPVLTLATVAAPAPAQVLLGGHGVYRTELLAEGFGIGARAEFDLGFVVPHLGLGGVYNRFSGDCEDCGSWEAAGQITLGEGMGYIGLNVLLSRLDQVVDEETTSTDDWKYSVVVGFRMLNVPVVAPFLEVRQSLGSGVLNDQAICLGILIGPARARKAPRPRR